MAACVDAESCLGSTHLMTSDDEQLVALLHREFLAQNLPKRTPEAETASELTSEAI
jgi:hypothetical protein